MTDPVEFLQAAHARAKQAAQALRDDLWWADQAERIEVYNSEGALIAGADETVRSLLDANSPAAVLRRIAKERKILEAHQQVEGAGHTPDDPREFYGHIASACSSCGTPEEYAVHYPCATVRLLAEAWGWEGQS